MKRNAASADFLHLSYVSRILRIIKTCHVKEADEAALSCARGIQGGRSVEGEDNEVSPGGAINMYQGSQVRPFASEPVELERALRTTGR